jgi:hypothetical protein
VVASKREKDRAAERALSAPGMLLLLLLYNFADQREFPLEVLQETSIPNSASGKSTRRSVHLIAF